MYTITCDHVYCYEIAPRLCYVDVTRLAPPPKYKRMKKFQAYDPENQFQIGDLFQLEKFKPISKKKKILAIPIPKQLKENESQDLGL